MFPIDHINERTFAANWSGEVFVCDIDRTYLATRFSTLKGLARIPFEFAIDKQDIDGMVVLLREVRRGPAPQSRCTPLYFISASPAQLRPVIQRKMLLDGLEFDGTTFKDWVGVLASLRLRRLREQLGFKITALLEGRRELPHAAMETLIGDDLETDALAFALYADLLSGRLAPGQVQRALTAQGVGLDDAQAILELHRGLPRADASSAPGGLRRADASSAPGGLRRADASSAPGGLPRADASSAPGGLRRADASSAPGGLRRADASPAPGGVRRSYIRMERHATPEALFDFAPHVVACRGALQMAFGLWEQGSISQEAVTRVAEDLAGRGWSSETIGERLRDACRRGLLGPRRAAALHDELASCKLLPAGLELPAVDPRWASAAHVDAARPWTPARHLCL